MNLAIDARKALVDGSRLGLTASWLAIISDPPQRPGQVLGLPMKDPSVWGGEIDAGTYLRSEQSSTIRDEVRIRVRVRVREPEQV